MSTSFVVRWRTTLRDSGLRSTAKLVGLVLSTHMNAEGESCWPSVRRVAEEASLSERAVRGGLRELEHAGFLGTARGGGRRTGGEYASNSYRALLPNPASDSGNPAPPAGLSPAARSTNPAARSVSPAPAAGEDVHEDVHEDDHQEVDLGEEQTVLRDEESPSPSSSSFQIPASTNGATPAAAAYHEDEGSEVRIIDECMACWERPEEGVADYGRDWLCDRCAAERGLRHLPGPPPLRTPRRPPARHQAT
jgi:hypothetical protein